MLLKTQISEAFERQQTQFQNKSLGQERSILNSINTTSGEIIIVTGARRVGKSTLLKQLAGKAENIAFVNFEDPLLFGFELSDFGKLDEVMGEQAELLYLFDEVQVIKQWEIFVRNLHDRQKKIVITGSNASLLSKELGTRLTGRHHTVELFPFPYHEYCTFLNLISSTNTFKTYLETGGFPQYVKNQSTEYLNQLLLDILNRDIAIRYGVRNTETLIALALFMITNIGKLYTINGLKKTFNIGSTNSVADYLSWFEDSYLIFTIQKFSWSIKSRFVSPKKCYAIDTGFVRANSLSHSDDLGRLLENAIFLQLRRKYKTVFYFKEKKECDFVIPQKDRTYLLIQVCYELHVDNKDREINGLIEALHFFDQKEGFIITMDQKDELKIEEYTIKLIPAHEWMQE